MAKEVKRLGDKDMAIIGKYFNDLSDFKNVTMTCKEYSELIDLYHDNPIPVHSRGEAEIFRNLETLHLDSEGDSRIVFTQNYRPKCITFDYPVDIDTMKTTQEYLEARDIKITGECYKSDIVVDMNEQVVQLKECAIDSPTELDLSNTKIREIPDGFFTDRPGTVFEEKPPFFFTTRTTLVSIELPTTVTRLGEACFMNCVNLNHVGMPPHLKRIGRLCFRNCNHLSTITIPSTVTELEESTFQSCDHLEVVNLPETLKEIGDSCFRYCYSLQYISIPSSVVRLRNFIFDSCRSLTQIELNANVEALPTAFLCNCTSLEYIEIPKTVTGIRDHCFYGCSNLKGIKNAENIIDISWSSFYHCNNLLLPKKLKELEDYKYYKEERREGEDQLEFYKAFYQRFKKEQEIEQAHRDYVGNATWFGVEPNFNNPFGQQFNQGTNWRKWG